jgi:hypothetical protein
VFLARLTGWFSGLLALLTVFLLVFLVMLFPDGRLPSRRLRPLLWVMLLVVVGGMAAQLQHGETIDGGFTNVLSAAGVSYPNPVEISPVPC